MKLNVGVIFGGKSVEHEVSIITAIQAMDHIDKEKYEIIPIYITKSLEWIRINDSLELLDTPGILWPKLDDREVALNLASMTAIREEILNKEEVAIYIIKKMLKEYKDNIVNRYRLSNETDIVDVLDSIGKHIGAVKNNETDYDRVYDVILKDLRDGMLGKVTFDSYED